MSSAWLFKGPGFPRAMTIAALGKNGDQIDRLFTESAELLVLQHCHEITPAVAGMMDAYAHDRPRGVRRALVSIDFRRLESPIRRVRLLRPRKVRRPSSRISQ